ncbi:unnamed protein product [Ectocarpus sp. 6 AP-2014]
MRVIAHRGDSKDFGDNNMESFKSACKLGVDGIEMDIAITKCDHLIMNHNPIDKETGVPINTRNLLSTDLELETVLIEIKNDMFEFILDIKDNRVYSNICREVYELCLKHKCLDRCVFSSFSENNLRDLNNIEKVTGSKLKKAYISSNMKEDLFSSSLDTFNITHVIIYKFVVNQEVVDLCHRKDVQVYSYTCNKHGLYDYMKTLGCDGVITDTPGSFLYLEL